MLIHDTMRILMAEPKATLANWRNAPHNRWAFHHVRELVPSADIPEDPRTVRALPEAPADFAQFRPFIEAMRKRLAHA